MFFEVFYSAAYRWQNTKNIWITADSTEIKLGWYHGKHCEHRYESLSFGETLSEHAKSHCQKSKGINVSTMSLQGRSKKNTQLTACVLLLLDLFVPGIQRSFQTCPLVLTKFSHRRYWMDCVDKIWMIGIDR